MLKRDFIFSGIGWILTTSSVLSATKSREVTEIVVKKSKRKLYLFSGNEVIKSYKVDLGFAPKGHKNLRAMARLLRERTKLIGRTLTANIIYLLESLTQTKKINSLQS